MQSHRGFTLIELMIAVAVIGILSAIAYPSYQDSVRKSWRANAAACLSELSLGMERRYTAAGSYVFTSPDTPAGFIASYGCTQEPDMPSRYTFSFSPTPTPTAFTVQAAPVASGPQAGDSCGTLALNHMGQKTAGGDMSLCWRR